MPDLSIETILFGRSLLRSVFIAFVHRGPDAFEQVVVKVYLILSYLSFRFRQLDKMTVEQPLGLNPMLLGMGLHDDAMETAPPTCSLC